MASKRRSGRTAGPGFHLCSGTMRTLPMLESARVAVGQLGRLGCGPALPGLPFLLRNLPQQEALSWVFFFFFFFFFKLSLDPSFLWFLKMGKFQLVFPWIFFFPFQSFASAIPFCLVVHYFAL